MVGAEQLVTAEKILTAEIAENTERKREKNF